MYRDIREYIGVEIPGGISEAVKGDRVRYLDKSSRCMDAASSFSSGRTSAGYVLGAGGEETAFSPEAVRGGMHLRVRRAMIWMIACEVEGGDGG